VAGVNGWLNGRSAQTVQEVVKTSLKALERRKQYVVSGWANYFLTLLVRIANRRTVVRESMRMFRPIKRIEPGENVPKR